MNMKTRQLTYKAIIAVTAVGLLLCLLTMGSSQNSDTRCTVYSKSRNGLMAINDTLKDSGFDVQLCLDPLSSSLPDGTLFILSPMAAPGPSEIEALKTWVSRGNTLVCTTSGPKLDISLGIPQTGNISGVKSAPTINCPLTNDVTSIRVPGAFDAISDTFDFGDLSTAAKISVGSRFNDKREAPPKNTNGVAVATLFSANKTPVAGIAGWGRGRVIVLGDPGCFTNSLVGKDDNAMFVANILQSSAEAGRRRAIFYEYGNGYARMLPGAGLMRLIDKPVKTGLIIFTVAFILLVLLEAQRFGPVRELMEKTRFRSEYLGSLADLLKRGGGTDVVLDELGAKFRDDVSKQLGLNNKADISFIVETARNRGLHNHTLLQELLLEAGNTHGSVSDESALMISRQWYKMRKELSTLR